MKVGDGNNISDPGELLERMREAHRQAATIQAGEAGSGDKTSASAAGSSESVTGSDASDAAGALQARLLDTAQSVLAGAFDTTADVRRTVVQAIVTERYADRLGPAQTEQITRTLEITLSDDPVFREEVDNMLLHAARELARRGD